MIGVSSHSAKSQEKQALEGTDVLVSFPQCVHIEGCIVGALLNFTGAFRMKFLDLFFGFLDSDFDGFV